MSLLSVPELSAHAWTGHYKPHGDVADADCVVGFSFGYRGKPDHDVTPGLSNQDLANDALKFFPRMPKILQFEIADAYRDAGGKDKPHRIEKHRDPHKYLDTREIAVQAMAIMIEKGWKTAALLAHPSHLPRCEAVCRKLGMEVVIIPDLKGTVEFDPLSSQKWTRNEDQWRGYEPMAMTFYALKGWI